MRNWDRLLFGLGCLFLVFFYGVAVGKYQVFPYDPINDAKDAVGAFVAEHVAPEPDYQTTTHSRGGVTRWEPAAAQDGLTLLALRRDGAMTAILVDMDGRELHRWTLAFSSVWPQAPHIVRQAADDRIDWHGIHLFRNGDLLLSFQGGNFPSGGGLVLIDRASTVRWKLARNTHHHLEVQPDGEIVVAAHEYREHGIPACAPFLKPPYYEDMVLLVTAGGQVHDQISVLEVLCRSPYRTVLMPTARRAHQSSIKIGDRHPLHLNNVNVLPERLRDRFPMARPGDILVSLRNLNLIAFIDRETRLLKWALTGHWVRQHDPDLLDNGNILLFDNRGGLPERGGSRILEIEPATQRIVWSFEGLDGDPFDAETQGEQQWLSGGTVLIAEPRGGRAIEVTHTVPPRIVWEYVNLRERTEAGGIVERVVHAQRYPREAVPFLSAP